MQASDGQQAAFIGGSLHGRPVPAALVSAPSIRAYTIDDEVAYRRIQWWHPAGSAIFFVSFDLKLTDLTGIIHSIVQRRASVDRKVSS